MKKYFLLICLAPVLLSCQSVPNHDQWEERDQFLVIEAEEGKFNAETSGWKFESTIAGFKGDGYVTWRGRGDWGPEKRAYDSIAHPSHIISYTFSINTSGTYYVKVLNYHLMEDGDNDVWTSVDKGPWEKTYDWQMNKWTIDERGEWARYNFNKGVHTVQLAGRSQGFAVDQVLIFHEAVKDRFIHR